MLNSLGCFPTVFRDTFFATGRAQAASNAEPRVLRNGELEILPAKRQVRIREPRIEREGPLRVLLRDADVAGERHLEAAPERVAVVRDHGKQGAVEQPGVAVVRSRRRPTTRGCPRRSTSC